MPFRFSVALLALGVLTFALSLTQGAWACVPQPLVTIVPRASGPPGSQATVQGMLFGAGTIEVRWNAVDGPQLAVGRGPQFSIAVAIPEVPDGLYSVLVFERLPGGGVGSSGRAAFQVIGVDGAASDRSDAGKATSRSEARDAVSGVPVGWAVAGGVALLILGGAVTTLAARAWPHRPRA